jgi:superoxide reductase
MAELVPNTVDASAEKHVPAVTVSGDRIEVRVGSAPHPMTEEHHISFVYAATENGGQRKGLKVDSPAEAVFSFADDKPLKVFAYCNLHGLWKADI